MATVTGPQLVLCSQEALSDPIRGRVNVLDYEGTLAGVNGLIAKLQWYERFELRQSDPPVYSIRVYSPDLVEAPVWELLANLKEKDITEHPKFGAVSQHNLKVLANFLRKPNENADPAFTGDPGQITLALELYVLELIGTKKYFTEEYVLRYQVTATNATQLNLAYSNTDKLFTPAQLVDPNVSGLIIPTGILASMANIPAKTIAAGSTLIWSWLKRAPTARQTQIGKVVISAEWWLDAWDSSVYDPLLTS